MNTERSLGAVFSDLLGEFTALFRSEIRLARAEFSEKFSDMGRGVALTAAGGGLLFAALLFFLAAAVGGLVAAGFKLWLAALIVAGATLIVGGVALSLGLSRLKTKTLAPRKILHQLQCDAEVARYQVKAQ